MKGQNKLHICKKIFNTGKSYLASRTGTKKVQGELYANKG